MPYSSDDLQALVDSLSGTSENFIANYSTSGLLQQAGETISMQAVHDLLAAVEDAGLGALSARNSIVNSTLELLCMRQQEEEAENNAQSSFTTTPTASCPISFDSVMCWPRTLAGSWAVLPCFEEFKGVHYDTTQNASRYCFANGTWNNYSNYDKCHHAMPASVSDFALSIELPAYIYCFGYFISFTALVVALIVFLYFKDLKCLRNTIHANLFLTYILSALLWILTLFLQVMTNNTSQAGCITLVIMFNYFNLTNFFWMFVEGLYLYTLVVQTFSSENIRFYVYAFIGWVCPALVVFVWSLAQVFFDTKTNEHSSVVGASDSLKKLDIECSWMRESQIDWIFQGPAAFVLLLNLIFLVRIMWVLITKLRSANTQETRQYLKAAKALMVLIPLFGITYLLVLTGPEQGLSRNVFEMLRASLISTQGFFVSLFFCFLNSEVRQALRHRFVRWRDDRDLRQGNSQRARRYRLSKDYSHRSRTESLRLTTTSPVSISHLE